MSRRGSSIRLTDAQREMIAAALLRVMEGTGFGQVVISVRYGRVVFVDETIRRKSDKAAVKGKRDGFDG